MNIKIILLDVLALLCQAFFVMLNYILAGYALRGHHYTFYYLLLGLLGLTLIWLSSRLKKTHADKIAIGVKFMHVMFSVVSIVGFGLGLLLTAWVIYAFVL